MSGREIVRLGSLHGAAEFQQHARSLGLEIPCDRELIAGVESPLRMPLERGGFRIGNRIAVNPMEGWDGTPDGNPSENTFRRWRRFGQSGAKLIWGAEAVAVRHSGRANPRQLVAAPHTRDGLARLREALLEEHRRVTGSLDGLLLGLQLTHSGRFCRPNAYDKAEPRILYHHPILDRRLGLPADYPLLTDAEIHGIIEDFVSAARMAAELGFDFVDIKHCHGYLGHEFLSAHTREGGFGGSFENRTRFLREIVAGIRAHAPRLQVGVRLSAFDTVPFRSDSHAQSPFRQGHGEPEPFGALVPYRWGFSVDASNPVEADFNETLRFLRMLEEMHIHLVNLTAGSPYYNPHIQRPALFPPSDGYLPPADPLIEVARHLAMVRDLKRRFPSLIFVGSAYSYLQDFLPNVAQAAVREDWVDFVGLGRVVLAYPEILWDATAGRPLQRRLVCRTFSDCTTAPRNGLPSGCYPLDRYYKDSPQAVKLREIKADRR